MKFDELTPPQIGILVDLLADTDAIFTPYRGGGFGAGPGLAGVLHRRSVYRKAGVPCLGSEIASDRKSAERVYSELAEAGALKLAVIGQRRHCRLTSVADWHLRSLVAMHSLLDGWAALLVIQVMGDALQAQADATNGCWMLNEFEIIGQKFTDAKARSEKGYVLEMRLLPALHRGYVNSICDGPGRCAYKITDAGRAALDAGPPDVPDGLPEFHQVFSDRYDSRFKSQLAAREHWTDPNGSLGIPASAGEWPIVPPEIQRLSMFAMGEVI